MGRSAEHPVPLAERRPRRAATQCSRAHGRDRRAFPETKNHGAGGTLHTWAGSLADAEMVHHILEGSEGLVAQHEQQDTLSRAMS